MKQFREKVDIRVTVNLHVNWKAGCEMLIQHAVVV